MTDSPRNRAEAIGMLPGNFRSLLEFGDTHPSGTEHHVLAIVPLPIFGKDTAFRLEALVNSSVGKRRDDCEPRQINPGLHGELGGLEEYVWFIMIEPKN